MQAILLIAHGSRRQASNDEVRELATQLANLSKQDYQVVECAFLELAEPSIPDGVTSCVKQGAKMVTVLPYFLSAGRHVTVDIPAELEKSKQQHPNVQLKVAPYIGSAEEISSILISLTKQAC